jgi:hypothetical protein
MESVQFVTDSDTVPPGVVTIKMKNRKTLLIRCTETIGPAGHLPVISPELPVSNVRIRDCTLEYDLSIPTSPGSKYVIDTTIEDCAGNSVTLNAGFYGYNPDIPEVIINEFITQGSGNHPDVLELKVNKGGNLGGVCVFEGTASDNEQGIVFPELQVETGEYIIVHFKPEGIPDEVDETVTPDQSAGLDSHPEAWDFWVKGGSGLSGNNGVLTVYTNPAGELMDAVIYSNRTSDSDEKYAGFGSAKTAERVKETADLGGWIFTGSIRPEETVNPDDSTSTRSICRTPDEPDSDTARDWHITPTRGASFGEENTAEIYSPR